MRFLLVVAFAALGAPAFAQAPHYEPVPFQPGKDVVWVPTPQALVDKMLDMARVTRDDFVMDLGSGDGRTVITAARRGARALGVEYDPDMVELSRRNAEKEGVSGRATFIKADLFETDFSRADVITMFLLPSINLVLRPKILGLKPGTRIVSNTFTMGDWAADEIARLTEAEGCKSSYCMALFWIVPARVAGIHKLPQGELILQQNFQMLSGSLRAEGRKSDVEGRVRGEEISFKAGGKEYHGRMNGKTIELR
jgi:precorrin-6B methylase 2